MAFFQGALGLFANFLRLHSTIKILHPSPCMVIFWNSPLFTDNDCRSDAIVSAALFDEILYFCLLILLNFYPKLERTKQKKFQHIVIFLLL